MSSKRTYIRNIQNEKKRIALVLEAASEEPASSSKETLASTQFDNIDIPEESNFSQDSKLSLREKLRDWYIQYNPSVQCCNSILKILKSENMDVPISAGGLMKKHECVPRTVHQGNISILDCKSNLRKGHPVEIQ